MNKLYSLTRFKKTYITLFIALFLFPTLGHGQGLCPPVGLPFYEDFNTTQLLPECWDKGENFDAEEMKAHVVGSPAFGIGSLMISCGADNTQVHQSIVMARKLTLSPSGIRMRIKMRANQAGAVIMVGVCKSGTTLNQLYGFVPVDTITIGSANTWNEYEIDFSNYSGDGDRPAFRMIQSMQGGHVGRIIYLDEMTIERCSVTGLSVSHRSSDELTLHWTSIGNGTADLTVRSQSGDTLQSFTSVTSPYRIQGLTPLTSYTLTLTPRCEGETLPGEDKSITSSTLTGPRSGLTYCEGFDASQLPEGWMGYGSATTQSSTIYDGSRALSIANGGYAVVPQTLVDGNALGFGQLMMELMAYSSSNSNRLLVAVTDYPEELSTFEPVDTLTVSAGSWTMCRPRLSRYSGTGRYLILKPLSGTFYIDALRMGRCLLSGVALREYTSSSITMEWGAPAAGDSVVVEPTVGGGTTTTVTAADCTVENGKWVYTISGLTPGSSHTYLVYGGCDDTPCDVASVSATTFAAEYTLPYCTDFEESGTLPTDWHNTTTYNSCPRLDNAQSHSGSRALKMNAYGNLSASHTLTVLPPVETGSASMVTVSFAAYTAYAGSTLQVGVITNPNNESTFTSRGSVSATSGDWHRYAVTVAAPAAGERLALRYYRSGSGERALWIDDLTVMECGVSGDEVHDVRSTGATLSWNSTGDTVDVQLRKNGTISMAPQADASSPLVFSGLEEGTTYAYYFRSRCGGESCWVYGGSFTTNDDAMRADYCHPTQESIGTTLWTLPYLEETSYTGLIVSLDNKSSNNGATLKVGLMTDPDVASTFTELASFPTVAGEWAHHHVSLTGHEAQGHYLALKSSSGTIQVRNLRISRGEAYDLTVEDESATSATLQWNETGVVDSVRVEVTPQGGGQTVSFVVTDTTLTLTGLTAGSTYTYVVTPYNGTSARNCSSLDGSFVTLHQDLQEGWCERFLYSNSSIPTGWRLIAGGNGATGIVTYSGSRWLNLSATGSEATVVAMPSAATAVNGLQLRLETVAPNGITEGSMLIAGVMTDAGDVTTFTPCDTVYPVASRRVSILDLRSYSGSGRVIALKYISGSGASSIYVTNLGLAAEQVGEPMASEVTNHSVRLTWSGAQQVKIRVGSDPWVNFTGQPVAGGRWSAVITNLSAGADHNFYIIPASGDSESNCQRVSVTARTMLVAMEVPLCYGFEDYYSNTGLPVGWLRPYGSYPVSQTGTRHSGSRALQFYASQSHCMGVSPVIEESTLEGLYVSFYHNAPAGSVWEVGVMSSSDDTASFTLVAMVSGTGSWTRSEVLLSGVPATDRFIAFRFRYTDGTGYGYLDDLMLQRCAMPVLTLDNPHSHSLDVSWTGGGEIWLEWGTSNNNMQRRRVSNSPYTLTGLSSSTNYTVRVWSICGTDSLFECHKVEAELQTLPEPLSLTYCQHFDGYAIPDDWSYQGPISSVYYGVTGRSVQMACYPSSPSLFIMPEVDVSDACNDISTVYVRFSVYKLSSSGTLEVGTVSDHSRGMETFGALHTIDISSLPPATWVDTVVGIPIALVDGGFIAFRLSGPAGIYLDDVCVAYCMGANARIIEQTATSVTVEWGGYGASGLAISWEGGSDTATTSPYTVTDLNPNQSYTFHFSFNCGCQAMGLCLGEGCGGNGGYTLLQPAEPMEIPNCYAMEESGFPESWRRFGSPYSNYPRTTTSRHYSGARSLDFYTSSDKPSTVVLEPVADTVGTLVVSGHLYCSNVDATMGPRFQVGLYTSQLEGGTFTPVDDITLDAVDHWESFHVVITRDMRQTAGADYIALRFSPTSTYHLYLDDLSVSTCGVSPISSDGDDITVTTLGDATHYLLSIHNNEDSTYRELTLDGGTRSLASIGLSPDTAYTLVAHPLCADSTGFVCNEESLVVGQHIALPYCHDFNTDGIDPMGWQVLSHNDGRYPRVENGHYVMKPNSNDPDNNDRVMLPALTGHTLGGVQVRLTMSTSSADRSYVELDLGYYSGGTFRTLAFLTNTNNTETHFVTLPDCSARQLVLRAASYSGSRTINIDDLQLSAYPEPIGVWELKTGSRWQHLRWDTIGGVSRYHVEWGPKGFTPGSGTVVYSDSCHLCLGPLTPSTHYQYYFLDTLGNRFCYPREFTSMDAPVDLTYCEPAQRSLNSNSLYILPEVELPVSQLTLLLDWRTGTSGRLEVGAVSNINNNGTFQAVDTLYPVSTSEFQRSAISLSSYSDTGHFVALRFVGASGYIRNLSLQSVPQPEFHVLNSSTIEVVPQDSTDFNVRVSSSADGTDTIYRITPNSSPLTHHSSLITNLTPYTQYNLYVMDTLSTSTCALPVTLRTHLDIATPYCTSLTSLPNGWNLAGRYRVMPYILSDNAVNLHLYATTKGTVTLGTLRTLYDTASFSPLSTLHYPLPTTSYFRIDSTQWITDSAHRYLAFRYDDGAAAVSDIVVQTVPRPQFAVESSHTISVTSPAGESLDYWVEVCHAGGLQGSGILHHIVSSGQQGSGSNTYLITDLDMFTPYDLYVLADSGQVTCAPPVRLQTHLDIYPPYCETLGPATEGWYSEGRFRVMPYTDVDTMTSVYVTFRSRGDLAIGSQSTLTDTASFSTLSTFHSPLSGDWEEHTVRLADYADSIAARHYIAFRGGELQSVYLHQCPVPAATLTAYNEVTFTLPDDETPDYWIEISAGGTPAYPSGEIVHATTNPFVIGGLEQNTPYAFRYRCDSATATCLPPANILTGVLMEVPHCAPLNGYTFRASSTLPAGWFTLEAAAGTRYAIMPIIDLDSIYPVYLRMRYRIPQAGTALEVGVMDSPYNENTFTHVATYSDVAGQNVEAILSLATYRGAGLYLAFRAIGSNPQNVVLDNVELQTVPFADYLLVGHNSVLVTAPDMPQPVDSFYISYSSSAGSGSVLVDTLPQLVTGLDPDATYHFSLLSLQSPLTTCVPSVEVNTTHLDTTPICGLQVNLYTSAPFWLGPELADPDISTLILHADVSSSTTGLRLVVGTMHVRNSDTSFHPLDTLTLNSSLSSIHSSLSRWNHHGRFLALKLLPNPATQTLSYSATLSNLSLDHCLPPQQASVALLRHNIVRVDAADADLSRELWLEYGAAGFTPGSGTIVRCDSLPMDLTLANSTDYEFILRCDSLGGFCLPRQSIRTLDAPPALAWCEDFEESTLGSLPSSWRTVSPLNNAQDIKLVSTRSHTPSKSLYFNSTLGHSNIVVLPDLGRDTLRGLSLSLWMNSAGNGRLEVGVISDASDPETFYPLKTFICSGSNRWERQLMDFADAPDSAYFIAMRCNGMSGDNRFWVDDIFISECGANSLHVTNVQADEITLAWRQTGNPSITVEVVPDNGTSWTIDLTDSAAQTLSSSASQILPVSGLTPLTNYTFYFSSLCDEGAGYCTSNYFDTCQVFTPAGGSECIDPTNLNASYTSCFYGTYGNPYSHTGVVNYGYVSPYSRHTVHYDLTELDPRTGNQLSTVPPGAAASVRLGNWSSSMSAPEAESIVYGITVDTLAFDLLIMQYAAVLQDALHDPKDQPRFSLELLDDQMHVIDSNCGRADFIANYQMGWNEADNNVLWKDWTTVGFDLSPYAGQTVYVRLTTRDCNEGSHYGYAYFTLRCGNKRVVASGCGIIADNEFTAPSGFNYRWYSSSNPSATLTNEQSIVVPSNNDVTYYCTLSFIDNPSCAFDISAFAGIRFPLALIEPQVELAPCSFVVGFNNRSTISSDGITPVGTGEPCETALWDFGNGLGSSSYHASAAYSTPGTYYVTLVSGIAGDECLDTLVMPLTLAFPETGLRMVGRDERCLNDAPDTLELYNVAAPFSDPLWTAVDSAIVGTHVLRHYRHVVDSASYAPGSYTLSVEAVDSVGCTHTVTHSFTVHPVYREYDTLDLCSLRFPYSWRDTTLNPAVTQPLSHSVTQLHRQTAGGCDSILTLNLHVYRNSDYTKRDTAYDAVCDNRSYYFSDSLLTPGAATGYQLGATSYLFHYTDSLFSSIGCDSLSTIELTVHPTYDDHLYDTVCSNHSYTWGTPQRQMVALDSVVVHTHAHDRATGYQVAATGYSFTDSLLSVHGCDSLSSLHLNVLPTYDLHFSDTICSNEWVTGSREWLAHSYPFENAAYDATGTYPHLFSTVHSRLSTQSLSCDSTRTLHLKVYPTYDIHLYDTIYDGDEYTFEGTSYNATGHYPHLLASSYGYAGFSPALQPATSCDSLRTLHLQCNRRTFIDTVVCQNGLPVRWHGGRLFSNDGGSRMGTMQVLRDTLHLRGVGGVDSLLVMTVIARDTAATVDIVHTCDSLIWQHTPDTTYRVSTDEPYKYLMQLSSFDTTGLYTQQPAPHLAPFTIHHSPFNIQCDSVRHLQLTVDYTHYATDYRIACDSLQWPMDAAGYPLPATRYYYRDTLGVPGPLGSHRVVGPVDTLLTVGGCDSVVNLDLNVHYATFEGVIDTFCHNRLYRWREHIVGDTADLYTTHHYDLADTLQTHTFTHHSTPLTITCDSILAIQLTQMARPHLSIVDSIDCRWEHYRLKLSTDVPYFKWTASTGHQLPATLWSTEDSVVDVSPTENTLYRAYVDYHETPLCPVSDSLWLRPIVVPQALMQVNPEALRYNAASFDAYDISIPDPRSIHPGDEELWTRTWLVDYEEQEEQSRHYHSEVEDFLTHADTLYMSLRVFNGQCPDTATKPLPILRVAIFAPNIFTPDENTNNRFIIVTRGVIDAQLYIYNREGLLVYKTDDLERGWNGVALDGTRCQQSAYVWRMIYHAIDHPEEEQSEVGTVTLVR